MSKQTAVEWLEEKLKENLKHIILNGDYVLMESIFLQAKTMEREQIIESYGVGHNDGCAYMTDGKTEFINSHQYYNETYKGE